jgi:hypothetical protein
MNTIHTLVREIKELLRHAIEFPEEERAYIQTILEELQYRALPKVVEMHKESFELRRKIQARNSCICEALSGELEPDCKRAIDYEIDKFSRYVPVGHALYKECQRIMLSHGDKIPLYNQYIRAKDDCDDIMCLVGLHDKIEDVTTNMERHMQAIKKRLLEFQSLTPEPTVVNTTRRRYRISEEAHALLLASVAETTTTTNSTSSTNSNSSSNCST